MSTFVCRFYVVDEREAEWAEPGFMELLLLPLHVALKFQFHRRARCIVKGFAL